MDIRRYSHHDPKNILCDLRKWAILGGRLYAITLKIKKFPSLHIGLHLGYFGIVVGYKVPLQTNPDIIVSERLLGWNPPPPPIREGMNLYRKNWEKRYIHRALAYPISDAKGTNI